MGGIERANYGVSLDLTSDGLPRCVDDRARANEVCLCVWQRHEPRKGK